MLISKELAKAFNEQIGHEFGASMQYVSIAAHFNQRQLKLLAKLFFDQAAAQGFPVTAVRFWETPTSFATYSRGAGEPGSMGA